SNLDAKLRVQMRAEIKELHQRLKTTTVYVTHDQIEAMTMADKIVVMHDGLVEQIGPPLELYDRPNNLFVASFIGSPAMNMLRGEIASDGGSPSFRGSGGISLPLAAVPSIGSGEQVVLGIRPEHLRLSEGQGIPVTVAVVEPTGSEVQLIGRTAGGEEIVANFRERHSFTPGETVWLTAEPGLIHLFHGETGQRFDMRTRQ
ncbi:MAG: TOBE domain-containing protein, partial [Mesorhizobium sp.]